MTDGLHITTLGETGSRVVFCHGLFGQGKNWTTVAKTLADRHRVLLVDMPNHGRSAWTPEVDYVAMADQVAGLLSADDPVALVGHSMGAKIAMLVALRHPELVARLCVVDMSPVSYPPHRDFTDFVTAMRAVDLAHLQRRADADAQLVDLVPDPVVRSFLLQNLRHEGDSWRWQMNLAVLGDHLRELGEWPDPGPVPPYDGPVLWVGGARSGYVRDEYQPAMVALFPKVRRVTVKDAGHWVHSEQPAIFAEVLRRFVDAAR